MNRVIDDYLLTNVDKVVAVNLYQAGFDIVGVRECGDIDWMLSPVYDEEIGDDVDLEPEEAIQKIMEHEGEVFLASYIPISFVEVKGTENVIKTKFSVGDIVYGFKTDYSANYSPGSIRCFKVAGISIKQAQYLYEMVLADRSRQTRETMSVASSKKEVNEEILYFVVEHDEKKPNTCASRYAIAMEEKYLFSSKEELKNSI